MRPAALALVVVSMSAPASAEPVDWRDMVVSIVRVSDDGGRVAAGPVIGAGLDDGARRDTTAGVRALWFASGDVAIGAELRDVIGASDPLRGLDVPDVLGPRRTRTASADVGYRVAIGKLAAFGTIQRFDLFASIGAGAVWTEPGGAHPGGTAAVALRVRLGGPVELELGLHDDVYRIAPATRAVVLARTIGPAPAAGPSWQDALEARASLLFLWPTTPHAHCLYIEDDAPPPPGQRKNPLEGQPAI